MLPKTGNEEFLILPKTGNEEFFMLLYRNDDAGKVWLALNEKIVGAEVKAAAKKDNKKPAVEATQT